MTLISRVRFSSVSRIGPHRLVTVAVAALFVGGLIGLQAARGADKPITYPKARKGAQVDDYHGTKVADPYRWLEDPDTEESRTWIEAQNRLTFGYLEKIPARDKIKKRLTQLWDYERYGLPHKRGGRYVFTKNDGLQNQDVLFTVKSLKDTPKVLLDPNKLSDDGTVSLTGYELSENGRYLAYGLSDGGSDWQEWRVRDIESGKDLTDVVKWVKFSGAAWTHDNKGFFYSRYDEPKAGDELKGSNYFQKLYYHKLGTLQLADKLVYERKDHKDWGFGGSVTDDGRYLIINVSKGTERKNLVFYKDLQKPNAPIVELISKFEAKFRLIDNDGTKFWFYTDFRAPRGHVVTIDITKPERINWKPLIPQVTATLRGVSSVGNRLVASYLKDAYTQIAIFYTDGVLERMVDLPGIGSAGGFYGRRGDSETFYSYTSFTNPRTIYRYDFETGESTIFREPKVAINPEDFETKQVFYRSKDGTKIPMFITHKRGLKMDGSNPTYLYGYGGFDIPITPRFRVQNVVWMELGGIYAVANIRGGGEYGKAWHDAGKKFNKQNCFTDFIAAGEWLIDQGYTSTPKLAIGGGSNGGLLVGACITQRPDLFAAALPAVGVMDMLRFNKFTIGWAWTSDYGSPENEAEFKTLYAYSPLHNLRPGTAYPATLITTGDHDDRVFPAHSFKFAATIQEMQSGPAPTLIRIETRAGHGAGKPTTKRIEEAADRWTFLVKNLGMNVD